MCSLPWLPLQEDEVEDWLLEDMEWQGDVSMRDLGDPLLLESLLKSTK
jgi:hypothetical protein